MTEPCNCDILLTVSTFKYYYKSVYYPDGAKVEDTPDPRRPPLLHFVYAPLGY
jgi:hypothetical protein